MVKLIYDYFSNKFLLMNTSPAMYAANCVRRNGAAHGDLAIPGGDFQPEHILGILAGEAVMQIEFLRPRIAGGNGGIDPCPQLRIFVPHLARPSNQRPKEHIACHRLALHGNIQVDRSIRENIRLHDADDIRAWRSSFQAQQSRSGSTNLFYHGFPAFARAMKKGNMVA